MIKIDDAGTGCCMGTPIIVGYREETKDVKSVLYKNKDILEICKEIIDYFNPSKEEPIYICQGNIFTGVVKIYKSMGYNMIPGRIEGEFQDIAEDIFMEQLYNLGLSRRVVLHEKDYIRLYNDIVSDILINPQIVTNMNSKAIRTKAVKEVMRQVDRLTNEFPNLYKQLLGSN